MNPLQGWLSGLISAGPRGFGGAQGPGPSDSLHRLWLRQHDGLRGSDLESKIWKALLKHVRACVSSKTLPFTDVLIVLPDLGLDPDLLQQAIAGQLVGFMASKKLKHPFKRFSPYVQIQTVSQEPFSGLFNLREDQFITGLLPHRYMETGVLTPSAHVYLHLPEQWEGYQLVGTLGRQQLCFTLGSFPLDSYCHAGLQRPSLYQLHQSNKGNIQHMIHPDHRRAYGLEVQQEEEAPLIRIFRRDGPALAWLALTPEEVSLEDLPALPPPRRSGGRPLTIPIRDRSGAGQPPRAASAPLREAIQLRPEQPAQAQHRPRIQLSVSPSPLVSREPQTSEAHEPASIQLSPVGQPKPSKPAPSLSYMASTTKVHAEAFQPASEVLSSEGSPQPSHPELLPSSQQARLRTSETLKEERETAESVAEESEPPKVEQIRPRAAVRTLRPLSSPEDLLSLLERGVLLQKIHFPHLMTGYDIFIDAAGQLVTHCTEPVATLHVHSEGVTLTAHHPAFHLNRTRPPLESTQPLGETALMEFHQQPLLFRSLRHVDLPRWPYVGEIVRPQEQLHLPFGARYRVGRDHRCRVRLPDDPHNQNIHWRPELGRSNTLKTTRGELKRSDFYIDSIMVASEHCELDLLEEQPYLRAIAQHCPCYVRRGSKLILLHPERSDRDTPPTQLQSRDELLIGNSLFQVYFEVQERGEAGELVQEEDSSRSASSPRPSAAAAAPQPPSQDAPEEEEPPPTDVPEILESAAADSTQEGSSLAPRGDRAKQAPAADHTAEGTDSLPEGELPASTRPEAPSARERAPESRAQRRSVSRRGSDGAKKTPSSVSREESSTTRATQGAAEVRETKGLPARRAAPSSPAPLSGAKKRGQGAEARAGNKKLGRLRSLESLTGHQKAQKRPSRAQPSADKQPRPETGERSSGRIVPSSPRPGRREVVSVDELQLSQELARPGRLELVGWMASGDLLIGNHTGADIVLPELRANALQNLIPRDYARLRSRGSKGSAVLVDHHHARLLGGPGSSWMGTRLEFTRFDAEGEVDFNIPLVIKPGRGLPSPRACLLTLGRGNSIVQGLFSVGLPLNTLRRVSLGGQEMTLEFDGHQLTVSDYLEGYREQEGFRPFFWDHEGMLCTVPEDGQSIQLRAGSRLIVGRNVYRFQRRGRH